MVGDVHYGSLAWPVSPLVYAPFAQNDWTNSMSVVVRVEGDPRSAVSAVRHAVSEIDKGQPIGGVSTMDEVLSGSVAQPRLQSMLLGLFGGLAVILAGVGTYGLISYSVAQRQSEIGIRMALGANRFVVLKMVLAQALSLAGLRPSIGPISPVIFTRSLQSLLYEVKPADPVVFTVILAFLLGVVFLAGYIPARRATKIEPVVALRYQ